MTIRFLTKEQSNKEQALQFLDLSPPERFNRFLWLAKRMSKYPTKKVTQKQKRDTFTIQIKPSLMQDTWNDNILNFIKYSNEAGVRMLMVGGGAVNFHGYQRHSADVDFWIETTEDNFKKLVAVFQKMGYEILDFPSDVKQQLQNISIKFSPEDLDLELITRFSVGKTFDEAYQNSELAEVENTTFYKWHVLSLEDLITSKLKAARPKDLLDVQELKRIREL